MKLPLLERNKTEEQTTSKKFHYDTESLKAHKINNRTFWTCEIIADRDIEIDYTFGVLHHHQVIPKGARGGRVWVNFKLLGSPEFDYRGGLSQDGNCWVGHRSVVGFGSYVNEDALIIDESVLFNVKVSNRAVVSKSNIFCVNAETSAIINDCQVSNAFVNVADLNMRDYAKLLYTKVEKRADCVCGGLSMRDNGILNHCKLTSTSNEHISVSGKTVHSDKIIEGYGSSNGANVSVEKNITD